MFGWPPTFYKIFASALTGSSGGSDVNDRSTAAVLKISSQEGGPFNLCTLKHVASLCFLEKNNNINLSLIM